MFGRGSWVAAPAVADASCPGGIRPGAIRIGTPAIPIAAHDTGAGGVGATGTIATCSWTGSCAGRLAIPLAVSAAFPAFTWLTNAMNPAPSCVSARLVCRTPAAMSPTSGYTCWCPSSSAASFVVVAIAAASLAATKAPNDSRRPDGSPTISTFVMSVPATFSVSIVAPHQGRSGLSLPLHFPRRACAPPILPMRRQPPSPPRQYHALPSCDPLSRQRPFMRAPAFSPARISVSMIFFASRGAFEFTIIILAVGNEGELGPPEIRLASPPRQ